MYSAITANEISSAAYRDGYRWPCDYANPNNLMVALCIAPNLPDYHWYRLTSMSGSARWTHKPGSTRATNLDNSGNYIVDLQTANRGPYTVWGGCMYSPGTARTTVR